MTQPNEMLLIGAVDEPSRMFSTTSGDSMYELTESYRKMTLIKPDKRVNLREFFPETNRANLTKDVLDSIAGAGYRITDYYSCGLRDGYLFCPACGYFTRSAGHVGEGVMCSMCSSIAVKYSKNNLAKLVEVAEKMATDIFVTRCVSDETSSRIIQMIELAGDGHIKVRLNHYRVMFYFDAIHFDRPSGHRFKRFANCAKWNEWMSPAFVGAGSVNPEITVTQIVRGSDEEWEKMKLFISEYGKQLCESEFQFIGDKEVVHKRRRAYIHEYMGRSSRNTMLNSVFATTSDEAVCEVASELVRTLPMDEEGIDMAVNVDGSIDFDVLFSSINKASMLTEIKRICCGVESVYNKVYDSLREEYRISV